MLIPLKGPIKGEVYFPSTVGLMGAPYSLILLFEKTHIACSSSKGATYQTQKKLSLNCVAS